MSLAHAYKELPDDPNEGFMLSAEDITAITERGETVFFTRQGKPVAKIDPIDPDQAWFWTPEWQAKEREADADIAAGRIERFGNDEEFLAALKASIETGQL